MNLPNHILIVEDELLTQRYLKDILRYYGVENIACTKNDQETLEYVQNNIPDIIIMDIHLRDSIDGIELGKEISIHHDIPILFASVTVNDDTIESASSIKSHSFIVKPFTKEDIKVAIYMAYKKTLLEKEAPIDETDIVKTDSKNKTKPKFHIAI